MTIKIYNSSDNLVFEGNETEFDKRIGWRHKNSSNFLYMDGHVKPDTLAYFQTTPKSGSRWWRPFFNWHGN